jgi:putative transcriptional regulator
MHAMAQVLTPLRFIRQQRNLSLQEVCDGIGGFDQGNLSRIERGETGASVEVAAKLAKFFDGAINEMQILYPERYEVNYVVAQRTPCNTGECAQ